MLSYLLFVLGLGFLVKGAGFLINGATSLAKHLKVNDLVIGLTIVSFGTSMPELVVSLIASIKGSSGIALGNVLGSNIANTLLILGVSAIIVPLTVRRSTALSEIPYSIIAALLLGFLANASFIETDTRLEITRFDGVVFLIFFVFYIYYTFFISRDREGENITSKYPDKGLNFSIILIITGIIMLFLGGRWVINGAIKMASALGISEGIIGLTVVAVGTSLPELVTSAVAAYRKNMDIAVGNVIGSNIFNIVFILGICSLVRPLPFESINNGDIMVVVSSAMVLLIALIAGKRYTITRAAGFFFLLAYIAYIYWLLIR